MRTRLGVALAIVASVIAACSTSGENGANAVVPDAAPSALGPYGASDCRACVASACGEALSDCAAEPSCAARVSCIDRCGVGPDGDADPSCVEACPSPIGAVAVEALARLSACHFTGAGSACGTCGLTPVDAGVPLPILAQHCPNAPKDASDPAACVDQHCCETLRACKGDCLDLFTCFSHCVGPRYPDLGACYHACEVDHPTGLAKGAPLLACVTYFCSRDLVATAKDCVGCQLDRCAKEWFDCHASPDCDPLYWCYAGCDQGSACVDGCFAQHPEGRAAFAATILCSSLQCPATCSSFL